MQQIETFHITLQDIINLEEGLLKVLETEKFTAPFQEIIEINKFAKELGEITTYYFNNITDYKDKLVSDKLSKEEVKTELINYNDKLLDSVITLTPENPTEYNLLAAYVDQKESK